MVTIRDGVGIDELRTMMNVAEAYDIVSVKKAKGQPTKYAFKSPDTGEIIEAVGIERFRLAMQKDQASLQSMMALCSEKIVAGFRAIDDEQLALLAGDAVIVKTQEDDEYDDGTDGPKVVDPSDMDVPVDEGLSAEALG